MAASFFLLASSCCLFISQTFAENGIRATEGITEGFHVALTLAKLFNYELRKHSIPRSVSVDMIAAIGSHIDPTKQNIPEKYGSLLNDTDFLAWQRRIENVSSNFGSCPFYKPKRFSGLSVYWSRVLQNLNKNTDEEPVREANSLDTDTFMTLDNAMKPIYPAMLGNVQILDYANHAPIARWEFENILRSIKNLKKTIKSRSSHIKNGNANMLLDFALYAIDVLEREINNALDENNVSLPL